MSLTTVEEAEMEISGSGDKAGAAELRKHSRSCSFSSNDVNHKSEPESVASSELTPTSPTTVVDEKNEVKIEMDDIALDSDTLDNSSPVALINPSTTVKIPISDEQCEDFSQEKDVPEVSTRVYDFNMVKEKTLPRIYFNSENGIFRMFSSNPKTYFLTWALMGASFIICIVVLVWYFAA